MVEGLGIWLSISVFCPKPDHFVAVFDNITDRKASEKALRKEEMRYRRLFDHATEGIVLTDPKTGVILDCNVAFQRLVGCRKADVVGRHRNLVFAVGDHPDPKTVGLGGKRGQIVDARLAVKGRQTKDVQVKESLMDLGGHIVVQSFVRDVSDQRRTQHERETTLAMLRLLNENHDVLELIEAVTRFLHEWTGCEAVAIRLQEGEDFPYYLTSGFPTEFVKAECRLCTPAPGGDVERDEEGNPVLDCMCGNILCGRFDPSKPFFTDSGSFWTNSTVLLLASTTEEDRQARTRNRCNGEGYESVALIRLRHADTTLGLIQVNDRRRDRFTPELIAFLEQLADQVAIALAQRLAATALRESEEAIRKLNARLEQRVKDRTTALEAANAELESFAYSISHDLRAPLRAIDGLASILAEDHGKHLGLDGQTICTRITGNARRMAQLIDDLLAYSRLGRTEISSDAIDMEAMAWSAFHNVVELADRARVDFTVGPLPPATGDPSLLEQVWVNLIGNAVKFSSKRERSVIEVGGNTQSGEAVYFVRDNGAGFDMAYVDKLFGVFQRLHAAGEFDGTGVGLAIVHRVVRRHGGRAWAVGALDQGATIYFSLPLTSK